ncbi:MAG: polyprenyl synthetase family protein [Limnobacter sp.]|uniref:polyprenyl synthetase family protein n=1 Tax=Limnobacter sp. TaxID=2003368 RepID=UPI00391AFFD9
MSTLVAGVTERSWVQDSRHSLEAQLKDHLARSAGPSESLNEAVQYALLDGGKRLRALLVYASGHVVGTPAQSLHAAACAIEALHAYSLVHDDLPCMDNDVLRRGKPTCHVRFGEATALLAGDALQTLAFDWLALPGELPASVQVKQIAALARASGPMGMAAGQAIDLAHVGKSMDWASLTGMHARKTGDLIAAAIRLGYLSQPDLDLGLQERLEGFAKALGLAYQVIDDILDVESSSDVLGKTSGKDALNNKPTAVSLLGLEAAKQLMSDLKAQALSALAPFEPDAAAPLRTLVDLITERSS